MNGYEKIIKRMRFESSNGDTLYQLMLGTMISSTTISLGDIKLTKDMYVKLDSIFKCNHCCPNSYGDDRKCEKKAELKKGDTVLVAPLSDEGYVLIGKVI